MSKSTCPITRVLYHSRDAAIGNSNAELAVGTIVKITTQVEGAKGIDRGKFVVVSCEPTDETEAEFSVNLKRK
jgi:hypothetical protein